MKTNILINGQRPEDLDKQLRKQRELEETKKTEEARRKEEEERREAEALERSKSFLNMFHFKDRCDLADVLLEGIEKVIGFDERTHLVNDGCGVAISVGKEIAMPYGNTSLWSSVCLALSYYARGRKEESKEYVKLIEKTIPHYKGPNSNIETELLIGNGPANPGVEYNARTSDNALLALLHKLQGNDARAKEVLTALRRVIGVHPSAQKEIFTLPRAVTVSSTEKEERDYRDDGKAHASYALARVNEQDVVALVLKAISHRAAEKNGVPMVGTGTIIPRVDRVSCDVDATLLEAITKHVLNDASGAKDLEKGASNYLTLEHVTTRAGYFASPPSRTFQLARDTGTSSKEKTYDTATNALYATLLCMNPARQSELEF